MIDHDKFLLLLKKYARRDAINVEDILFGSGINLSSISFTEFIMALEEDCDIDIDIDDLDASIKTVGQLYERLNR